MRHDYPTLRRHEARVMLVEGTGQILSTFPARLQQSALDQLGRLGVTVRLNTLVETVEGEQVRFKDGSHIESDIVVWAAGVRGALLGEALGVSLGKGKRVPVEQTLALAGHPEVFVIGDLCGLQTYGAQKDQPYPQVAQVAMQQGARAAANILAHLQGKEM